MGAAMAHTITLIPGSGTGLEVTRAVLRIIDAVCAAR
jgi:hypothetical protein